MSVARIPWLSGELPHTAIVGRRRIGGLPWKQIRIGAFGAMGSGLRKDQEATMTHHQHLLARALTVATLVSFAMFGCSSTNKDPRENGSTSGTAPKTAWGNALGAINADGTYSKDAALKLFAVAFGMPGVDRPSGKLGQIRSGTIALRAALAHESELTAAQRARIEEVRSLPDDSAGSPIVIDAAYQDASTGMSSARSVGQRLLPVSKPSASADSDLRNLIQAKARQLRQEIKARLGTDIPGKLTIVFDSRDEFVSGTRIRKAGAADARFVDDQYSECILHLYPATFESASDATTTTAHEMIHCFQAALYPSEDAYNNAPQWALEGSAEWGSASLVGPDSLDTTLWRQYLTGPGVPLFKKTYEALGFYAHLEETGHSPWAAFRTMWSTKGNEAQFAVLGGTSNDFLDSWASSMSRKDAFGAAWNTTGPGITDDDSAPRYPLTVGKSAAKVAAAPYAARIYALAADTDLIDVSITGHARLSDGMVDETSLSSRTFCLRPDQCTCPDGTSPEKSTQLASSGALLALTGGPDGASGTVQGRDLDCTARGATWHFDAPSRYSGGASHTTVDAYTCAGLRGPWKAKLHVTHGPAIPGDPALDRTVNFTWTFDRDGRAVPTIGPYEDTVFGRSHQITYYPKIQLNEKAGTITIVSLQGSEDDSPKLDVTHQLDRIGEAIPLKAMKPPKC